MKFFDALGALSAADMRQMERTYAAYQTLGAISNFSCTPYLFDNIPHNREVVAFSESSATPYVNSVFSARTNRESAQSAVCAAVTGRVAEYGLLLDANRNAQLVVNVAATMKNDFDYQLLGWVVPKKIGNTIPVFVGLPERVSPEALMYLCAQLNTAGAVPMFHIVGQTPEAPTLEAALGPYSDSHDVVTITDQDLRDVPELISNKPGKIDFVLLGCPHVSLDQVLRIAKLVEGKKLATELWINTSAHTVAMAQRMGAFDAIRAAGGYLVNDTCVDQPVWAHLEGKLGARESPKCAYYTQRRELRFVIRSIEQCIQAALVGEIA